MLFDEAIAAAIRILMEDKGFKTQKDFAEKIGISEQTVSKYLNGVSSPETKTRVSIAQAAGRSLEDFERLIALIVIFGEDEGSQRWRKGTASEAVLGEDAVTALLERLGLAPEEFEVEFNIALRKVGRLGALSLGLDRLNQTLDQLLEKHGAEPSD